MCNNLMGNVGTLLSLMDEETGHSSKEVVKLGFEIEKLGQETVILEPLPLPGFKISYNWGSKGEQDHWVVGILFDAEFS